MANIPDQVDAALMAKLRLQSQSPGEEERRLGVGWAWLRGAVEDGGRWTARWRTTPRSRKRAHTALPSLQSADGWALVGTGAGLPHRRSFGCDVGEACLFSDSRWTGGKRAAAAGDAVAGSVGPASQARGREQQQRGRADGGVWRVRLRVRLGGSTRGDRGAGCACDRRGRDLQPCDRNSGAESRRCRSIGRGRTGWSVVVDWTLDSDSGGKMWRRSHRTPGARIIWRSGETARRITGRQAVWETPTQMDRDTFERRCFLQRAWP